MARDSTQPDTQDRINRRVYHSAGVEREYTSQTLNRVETVTLLKYHAAFAGRDVLDIGVGTGRTSIYLAPLARRYEGIDYSPVMVANMRAQFPQISVRLADMRDLSPFEDAVFDFAFGSNNVIDAVSHDDRLRCLSELRRVLRPGATLAFTSHNRQYQNAGQGPVMAFSRNPVTQAMHLARWMLRRINHSRLKRLRKQDPEYALLNDKGHDFACLHYYVDHDTQRRQLSVAGFNVLDVLDQEGSSVPAGGHVTKSSWLMYVSQRE